MFGKNTHHKRLPTERPRPLSVRNDLPETVESLKRRLIPARVNRASFHADNPAILGILSAGSEIISLGNKPGPTSVHWQNDDSVKLLIRDIGRLQSPTEINRLTTTLVAHLKKFEEEGLPFPEKIYIDTGKGKMDESDLQEFVKVLMDKVNQLNHLSYEILGEADIEEKRYLALSIGEPTQPEKAESGLANPLLAKAKRRVEKGVDDLRDSFWEQDTDDIVNALSKRKGKNEDSDQISIEPIAANDDDDEPQDNMESGKVAAGKVSKLARDIINGVIDVQDEGLNLSQNNRHLLQGLVSQLKLLRETKRNLLQLEKNIEATLPPTIPLETLITFQPPLSPLRRQASEEVLQLTQSYKDHRNSPLAHMKLQDRLREGLKPASRLAGKGVAISGDDKVAHVVSVNVIPIPGAQASERAKFAATNRAGGAIPIAIEQQGDSGSNPDLEVLTQRAIDSAILIIDPAQLNVAQEQAVQRQQDSGGGELGLDEVGSAAIVAVLLPSTMQHLVSEDFVARRRVQFVGAKTSLIHYAGTQSEVEILHPDYETTLAQIFNENPKKTLLTHTTRLGNPNPIKGNPRDEEASL